MIHFCRLVETVGACFTLKDDVKAARMMVAFWDEIRIIFSSLRSSSCGHVNVQTSQAFKDDSYACV